MATTPSGQDPSGEAPAIGDAAAPRTHHDVGHAQTIGTGPVATAAGTGAGSYQYTMPRADGSTDLPAGELVGEYRIERKIGEGGMGVVYGAVHPLIGKRAAIKVLNKNLCMQPEAVERFVTEARAVNQIGHPNIVDIFSFGNLADGRSYFAMEWLEGRSLAERLRKGRPGLAESCALLDEIAEALESAHAKRIVHRDLKPDNIFLVSLPGGRTRVKLLDFGIAKLLDDSGDRVTRTRTGSLMGTPLYVAPEQARGYDIDARVDVYSLGAVAFEMVTGRPPFVADNAMDVVAMHLHSEPPRASTQVPTVPRALDELLLAMLAKDPDARPTLARVREVLAEVRAQPPEVAGAGAGAVAAPAVTAPSSAVAATVLQPVPEGMLEAPPARGAGRWLAVVGAVAVLGGGAFVVATRGSSSDDAPARPAAPTAADGVDPALDPAVDPDDDDGAGPAEPVIKEPELPAAGTAVATGAEAGTAAVAATAKLVLKVDPDGAVVSVGGVDHKAARGRVELTLPAGRHAVRVSAAGHQDKELDLDLAADETREVKAALVRKKRGDRGDRPGTARGTGKATGVAAGTTAGTSAGTSKPRVDDGEGVVNPFKKKP